MIHISTRDGLIPFTTGRQSGQTEYYVYEPIESMPVQ